MSQRPFLKLTAPKPEPSQTPSSATTSTPKITLKFGSTSQTPAPQLTPNQPAPSFASTGSKTAAKTPRKTKPTPKKRALEVADDDDNENGEEPQSAPGPTIKKIKLNTRAPLINLKTKRKVPERPKGVGYDSEADDRELDPTLSEAFILRMQPGPDCDIVRKAAADGNFGRKAGGADVRMRFLTSDGRRAAVSVNGRHYAAVLVDLPCVIEAMKNWEKRGPWMKSVDVCQMLVVMGQIKEEDDALLYPISSGKGALNERGELDVKTLQWASGITPPLHKVRTRRFRKRISVRDVMEVEAEVEALLRRDEEAEGEPLLELVDENELRERRDRENGESEEVSDDEEDAEGEDYEDEQGGYIETTVEGHDADHDAMAEELEAAMAASADADLPSAPPLDTSIQDSTYPPASPSGNLPTPSAADTPGAATTSADEASDEDDDSSDASVDEDALERQQERQRQREEIADLEAAIRQEQTKADSIGNALLKKKLLDKIRSLQGDLDLKLAALGG